MERERAHTCTFAEILNTCFANVKDNAFHYRLRLATERATMAKTCFLDREHRVRFQKALHRVRGNDKSLIAQLFVLMQMGLIFSLLQLLLFVIAIAPFCLAGGALNFVSKLGFWGAFGDPEIKYRMNVKANRSINAFNIHFQRECLQ